MSKRREAGDASAKRKSTLKIKIPTSPVIFKCYDDKSSGAIVIKKGAGDKSPST
jgi:hypothetical protein